MPQAYSLRCTGDYCCLLYPLIRRSTTFGKFPISNPVALFLLGFIIAYTRSMLLHCCHPLLTRGATRTVLSSAAAFSNPRFDAVNFVFEYFYKLYVWYQMWRCFYAAAPDLMETGKTQVINPCRRKHRGIINGSLKIDITGMLSAGSSLSATHSSSRGV